MLEQKIQLMEQFYDLYSHSLEAGWVSVQDWQIVEAIRGADHCNREQQEMIKRLLYSVSKGRIEIRHIAEVRAA
jgi:major membrane immunogen (membrane-anchored lipoprotein)